MAEIEMKTEANTSNQLYDKTSNKKQMSIFEDM